MTTNPKTSAQNHSTRVFIIEDDPIMAECLAGALIPQENYQIQAFTNALSAVSALDTELPDLILLDILLNGPDGFTFLNEIISYQDTSRIPVIIVSSLNLNHYNLGHYGVAKILSKETMTPNSILSAVRQALARSDLPQSRLEPGALVSDQRNSYAF